MLIGITGTSGAGKDTVSDFLKEKGFFHYSLSDAIREECDKRGLPKDRDVLIDLGNKLRAEEGNDVLAKRAMEAIKKMGTKNAVITSIRNPKEVEYLKSQGNFYLIFVDAPMELRYERIKNRGHETDNITLDRFREQEEREMEGASHQQNLSTVFTLADYEILNDGTMEEFTAKIKKITEKIKRICK